MTALRVDDRVRLIDDVPETDLVRGRVGVICSKWQIDRDPLFEVEFISDERDSVLRLLLRSTQLVADEVREEVAID